MSRFAYCNSTQRKYGVVSAHATLFKTFQYDDYSVRTQKYARSTRLAKKLGVNWTDKPVTRTKQLCFRIATFIRTRISFVIRLKVLLL